MSLGICVNFYVISKIVSAFRCDIFLKLFVYDCWARMLVAWHYLLRYVTLCFSSIRPFVVCFWENSAVRKHGWRGQHMCFSDVVSFHEQVASPLFAFPFLWVGDDSDGGGPHKCEWLLCLNNCVVLLLLFLLLLLLLFFFSLTTCWRCTQSLSLVECRHWNTPNLRSLISTCILIWDEETESAKRTREGLEVWEKNEENCLFRALICQTGLVLHFSFCNAR